MPLLKFELENEKVKNKMIKINIRKIELSLCVNYKRLLEIFYTKNNKIKLFTLIILSPF